ncbi:MAG: acyl carrier protein [Ruminococcaceae bacterium]|nr:acyl carrier protein [Oscillospiraceae bacterium]
MLDKIREIICSFVDVEPEEITGNSKLTSDLGLCSLDLAMLSTEIEREFGVSITAKTFATVKTVGGLMDYIKGII